MRPTDYACATCMREEHRCKCEPAHYGDTRGTYAHPPIASDYAKLRAALAGIASCGTKEGCAQMHAEIARKVLAETAEVPAGTFPSDPEPYDPRN